MRTTVAHAPEMPGVIDLRLRGADSDNGLDPGVAQHPDAVAGNERIGIFDGDDDAIHLRLDQFACAGRRLRLMRAGLERDVGGGAVQVVAVAACIQQRLDLGVVRAAACVKPSPSTRPSRAITQPTRGLAN